MKKVWLVGISIVLVMMVVSCDNFITPPQVPIEYSADGQQMANLSISTGGSNRALTDALAKSGANYYEVVFFDGSRYYRTAGWKGQNLRLSVPPADYLGPTKALMLAGRASDRTLLAAGIITEVDGTAVTTTADILATTTSVTFELTSLQAAVTRDVGTSAFLITAPSGPPSYVTAGTDNFAEINNIEYPMFKLPVNDNTITATYKIEGFTDTGAGIKVKGADPVLTSWGFGENLPETSVQGNIVIADNTAIETAGQLNIEIDTTGATDGYSLIFFNIPVMAIDTSTGGETWYLRGGLNNYEAETSDAARPNGGILLQVGSPSGGSGGLTIGTPTPQP